MGSPVSPIITNMFMEWLEQEQEAIATAPITCKLTETVEALRRRHPCDYRKRLYSLAYGPVTHTAIRLAIALRYKMYQNM